jgi:hypothetical protein
MLGEQGSCKTTSAKVARRNVDPNAAPTRTSPRSTDDLMVAANNSRCLAFDNLSVVSTELSDALCCLATGAGWGKRAHYTNGDETLMAATRPVILNGIEEMASRSDLLDRCVVLDLPEMPKEQRKPEKEFWAEYDKAEPGILGGLYDAVSAALRNLDATRERTKSLPRMADFALWCVAAEEAMGLKPGAFLKAYEANRLAANQTALESTPVAAALIALLDKKPVDTFIGNERYQFDAPLPFEGTATELLALLCVGKTADALHHRSWPKDAKTLSGILTRISPNLRSAGWVIGRKWKDREKVWTIDYATTQTTHAPEDCFPDRGGSEALSTSAKRKGPALPPSLLRDREKKV